MTKEQLEQANLLSAQIKALQAIIDSAKNQKCEWIEFNYGNGSGGKIVCNDKDIIDSVRDLLISRNTLKLKMLEADFLDI